MRAVKSHTIDGVRHKVNITDHLEGYVDIPHLRKNEEGEIYIDSYLPPPDFFETAVHEILHLVNPNWSEETVDKSAREVRRFVFDRLGYRRV